MTPRRMHNNFPSNVVVLQKRQRLYIQVPSLILFQYLNEEYFLFGRLFLCCNNASWQTAGKSDYFPFKWCHICGEHAFVGWATELSVWAAPMKDLPNLLCNQTAFLSLDLDSWLPCCCIIMSFLYMLLTDSAYVESDGAHLVTATWRSAFKLKYHFWVNMVISKYLWVLTVSYPHCYLDCQNHH